MIGRNALLGFAAAVALTQMAGAQTTALYSSGGFEPPRFTPGSLVGQDVPLAGTTGWVSVGDSGAVGTATVTTDPLNSANHVVQLTRTSGDQYYFPNLVSLPTLQRYVLVSWDEGVPSGVASGGTFGPFFGVASYDAATNPSSPAPIGLGGIDATTGEVLYEDPTLGLTTTAADTTVPFNASNHFQMTLDLQNKTYALAVNGQTVVSNVAFADPTASQFTDADLAGIAAQSEPPTETGTAFFDNYQVLTTSVVPEPASLGLVAIGVLGCIAGRRRRGA